MSECACVNASISLPISKDVEERRVEDWNMVLCPKKEAETSSLVQLSDLGGKEFR